MNLCIQCPTHLWLSKVFSYLSMIIFFTPKRCTNQWLPPIPVQQFPNVSPNIFGISIRELGNPHFNRKLLLVICSIRSTDNPMISTWYAMIIRHSISIRYLCIDPYIYTYIHMMSPWNQLEIRWSPQLLTMIPSFGCRLSETPGLAENLRRRTAQDLQL